jgi:lipopolysaccharide export system protein LptA
VRGGLVLAAFVVLLAVGTANAQPATVTVDAETIAYDSVQQVVTARGNVRMVARRYRIFADAARYDLRQGVVVATGSVRVIDFLGRELRGQTLTYNTRTEEGMLEPAEGLIDRERRVFLRSGRVEFTPQRVRTEQSFVTSCDPQHPLVHVTARRIEIVPEEELVAYDASVYFRGRRLYSTPRFVVSLVPGEEGVLIPGLGYNSTDGYWLDVRSRVRLPEARGLVRVKYGTVSGAFALLTLAHREPTYTATLRLGRTQTLDEKQAFNLLPYYVAEVGAETAPLRIGGTPFSWSARAAAGWFNDQTAAVSTTRLGAAVSLTSDPIPLSPRLSLALGAGLEVSLYGTGATRTLTTASAALTYALDQYSAAILRYDLRDTGGISPFVIDHVEVESTFSVGVRRIVPDRYRLEARVGYNALAAETKVTSTVAYVLTPSWEVAVSAIYNFRLAAFEDVDYTLRRICDCVDVVLRYRQIRREVSIEFGLVGFAERRAPFVPRSTPRPPVVAPAGVPPERGDQH